MCVRVCVVVVVVVVVVTKDFCWLLDLKVIKKKRILTFGMDCVGWGAVLDAGGGIKAKRRERSTCPAHSPRTDLLLTRLPSSPVTSTTPSHVELFSHPK